MARSSTADPVDKFRFRVTILKSADNIDFVTQVSSDPTNDELTTGFSSVVLPKSNVTEINYRENTDFNRHTKVPGLVRYEPVVLRKGVTSDRSLYNWYKQVNDDINSLSSLNRISADANIIPVYDPTYRRNVNIESLDRVGNVTKSWLLFEAFPTGFSGGNGLDAQSDEKLIAELTLSYEAFVELPTGDLEQAFQESVAAAKRATAAEGIRLVSGLAGAALGVL